MSKLRRCMLCKCVLPNVGILKQKVCEHCLDTYAGEEDINFHRTSKKNTDSYIQKTKTKKKKPKNLRNDWDSDL